MKQEEYLAAIKKQQSLIRKLFANRKRRSEVIDELTKERYGHIVGKFFKAGGERFRAVDEGDTLYICGVYAESNFVNSEQVYVSIVCRQIGQRYQLDGGKKIVCGLETYTQSFRFNPEDNIDEILAPLYVTQERAAEDVSAMCNELVKNFLKKI